MKNYDHNQKIFNHGSRLLHIYIDAKDGKGGTKEEIKNDIKKGEEAVWQNFHSEDAAELILQAKQMARKINKGK